jgi:hypothetical protein
MMNDFVIRHSKGNNGLNHYLIFVSDDLLASGTHSLPAVKALENGYIQLIDEIHSLNDTEVTPWIMQKTRYLDYLVDVFMHTTFIHSRPEWMKTLKESDERVKEKLLSFPSIKIEP